MTLSGKKYLTAIVVIIVYIEEVGALIATLCKYAWSNSPKKGWYILFLKELHVATVATATIIISDANDVAGVSDRVLQLATVVSTTRRIGNIYQNLQKLQ